MRGATGMGSAGNAERVEGLLQRHVRAMVDLNTRIDTQTVRLKDLADGVFGRLPQADIPKEQPLARVEGVMQDLEDGTAALHLRLTELTEQVDRLVHLA